MWDNDTKQCLIICSTVVIVVSVVAFAIAWTWATTYADMSSKGYYQTSLPGVSGVHWVKGKEGHCERE